MSCCRDLLTINYHGNFDHLLAKAGEKLSENDKLHINLHPTTLEAAKLAKLSYKGKTKIIQGLGIKIKKTINNILIL